MKLKCDKKNRKITNNKAGGLQRITHLTTALLIVFSITSVSCKDSDNDNSIPVNDNCSVAFNAPENTDPCSEEAYNFISDVARATGRAMDADWCMEAQIDLASLEGSAVGRDQIDETIYSRQTDFSGTLSDIDITAEKPIKILTWLSYMELPVESFFGSKIPKEIQCKLRSKDSIEDLLEFDLDGTDDGYCRDINQKALDWALSQLNETQLTRYEDTGRTLVFVEDQVFGAGGGWVGAPIVYTEVGETIEVTAPAMYVSYNDPELDATTDVKYKGVHYCKLLAPSQILFWLVERTFWYDPLGACPEESGFTDAELTVDGEETECRVQDPTIAGSCLFYFSPVTQWFCNDFTGELWSQDSAAMYTKCDSRSSEEYPSVWSESPCSEREDETGGPTLGECVVSCGNNDEQRWNVYNLDDFEDGYEACPMKWFPAGSKNVSQNLIF